MSGQQLGPARAREAKGGHTTTSATPDSAPFVSASVTPGARSKLEL